MLHRQFFCFSTMSTKLLKSCGTPHGESWSLSDLVTRYHLEYLIRNPMKHKSTLRAIWRKKTHHFLQHDIKSEPHSDIWVKLGCSSHPGSTTGPIFSLMLALRLLNGKLHNILLWTKHSSSHMKLTRNLGCSAKFESGNGGLVFKKSLQTSPQSNV